ncbi:amino acid transporter [Oxalobacteraceae bacterium]|nr:amino acid transporter [Oxalobacteraceae bacterium]
MLSGAFFKGMGLGGSLIVAIGAQNAFLLKQGVLRQHAFACALVCIVCDVVLIAVGVTGMGRLIASNPELLHWLKIGGALFLFEYGRRAAWSAWRPGRAEGLSAAPGGAPVTRGQVMRTTLALSLLNPHVMLDTVVLLGSISIQQPDGGSYLFSGGAMAASVLWFLLVAWGARFLAPLFARPGAWRVLDAIVALIMWSIAISLLL